MLSMDNLSVVLVAIFVLAVVAVEGYNKIFGRRREGGIRLEGDEREGEKYWDETRMVLVQVEEDEGLPRYEDEPLREGK